jgi:hypothetical protein
MVNPLPLHVRSPDQTVRARKVPTLRGFLGNWLAFIRQRRRDNGIIEDLHRQLNSRANNVDESWVNTDDMRCVKQHLCNSLQKIFSWDSNKILANDPIALLLFSKDDLDIADFQLDLETWLQKSLDPMFFNRDFMAFSFREAVEWLAMQYRQSGTCTSN